MDKVQSKVIKPRVYTGTFDITVSTAVVAVKLMESFNPDMPLPRREKLVESIIAPMEVNSNREGLKHLFFALMDFSLDAPVFKVDDLLYCNAKAYTNVIGESDKYEEKYQEIGKCKLIDNDLLLKDKEDA